MQLPRIISVDDHVVEPGSVWESRMAKKFLPNAPRLSAKKGVVGWNSRSPVFVEDDSGDWVSTWTYFDLNWPLSIGMAAVGRPHSQFLEGRAVHYDNIHPGCFNQSERLKAMDENHTEASICFPSFPRFCGQVFLERGDRETSAAAVRAYNDWMIDEWCAGDGYGRLIPLTLIPLWDPVASAAEVRRCAAKGSHAISFSESPTALDLPGLQSDHWDVLWAACDETNTVVNMHIGSSSTLPSAAPDSPRLGNVALTFENSMHSLINWITSGALERFKNLKIAFSEGQVGWMPFILERLDNLWARSPEFFQVADQVRKPPSEYIPGRIYGCLFDDLAGLQARDAIGMSQLMFETDFPHADSTWPHSRDTAETLVTKAGLNEREIWMLLRGNAIECYDLNRFGITA